MRRRWHVNWYLLPALWSIGGLIPFLIVGALQGCDKYGNCGLNNTTHSTSLLVVGCLWVGPFIFVAAGYLFMAIWKALPHRIWEPVEDIRVSERIKEN